MIFLKSPEGSILEILLKLQRIAICNNGGFLATILDHRKQLNEHNFYSKGAQHSTALFKFKKSFIILFQSKHLKYWKDLLTSPSTRTSRAHESFIVANVVSHNFHELGPFYTST